MTFAAPAETLPFADASFDAALAQLVLNFLAEPRRGVGPAGAYCAALDERRRHALRDALQTRLGMGEAPFVLTARAWAVAGTV